MRRLMVVLVASLLTGCSSGSSGVEEHPLDSMTAVDGSTFRSTQVTGHDLVDQTSIVLTFDGDRLSANAGCNQMSAQASVTDGKLKWVGHPMSTMMACDEAKTRQDAWLTELLVGGVQAQTAPRRLILTDGDITVDLVNEATTK